MHGTDDRNTDDHITEHKNIWQRWMNILGEEFN